MSNATISGSKAKVESDRAKDDGRRRVNHFVSKADITEQIVTGKRITALCGNRSWPRPKATGAQRPHPAAERSYASHARTSTTSCRVAATRARRPARDERLVGTPKPDRTRLFTTDMRTTFMLANPVFTLDLAKYHYDSSCRLPTYNDYELDRQMFSIMPQLPTGTNVRFLVHGYRPQGDRPGWLRPDVNLQVEATDPGVIAAWMSALPEEEAAA